MTTEQLTALCSFLVLLLAGSEALPFMKTIRANSWAQLVIAVIKAIASVKTSRR